MPTLYIRDVPQTVKDRLEKLAKADDRSVNYYVKQVLKQHTEESKK